MLFQCLDGEKMVKAQWVRSLNLIKEIVKDVRIKQDKKKKKRKKEKKKKKKLKKQKKVPVANLKMIEIASMIVKNRRKYMRNMNKKKNKKY